MTTATRLVRKVMRENGIKTVFTNKYDNCRTVKCYMVDFTATVQAKIAAALKEANIEATMKTIKRTSKGWGPRSSFIVRLPL